MKKRILKIISTVFAFIFLVSASACGKDGNKESGNISVMLLDTGIGIKWIEELRDNFYDETGISVEVDSDTQLSDYLSQNMAMDGNVSADLYLANSTYDWINWVYNDYIVDLSDLCAESYDDGSTLESTIKSDIRNLGKVGTHRYIIQLTYAPTGIVYNKDLLTEMYNAGKITYSSFPTKWSDLVILAKQVTDANYTYNGNKVYGMVWGDQDFDLSDLFKTLWAQGDYRKYQEYFEQENVLNDELFLSDERLNALQAIYDLVDSKDGKSSTSVPNMMAQSHAEAYLSFLNGNALFCFSGSWFETEMDEYIDEDTFEYCFAPVPALSENEISVNINYPTEFFFIPKCSENAELASKFLKFMFREDNLIKIHNAIQTPVAFEYDTKNLQLTRWGEEVQSVMNYKNTVSGASSLFYQVSGLRPELEGNAFKKIYNGSITRENLLAVLANDYSIKDNGWSNKCALANKFKQAFIEKGIIAE